VTAAVGAFEVEFGRFGAERRVRAFRRHDCILVEAGNAMRASIVAERR
jgi:hypothetical protein